jgi:ubiquinone/menaquinone biosynthesis C-methylase UbiE
MNRIQDQVRYFYDQVGWHQVSEGVYQNARYEDLRPVAREYIHQCHLRVVQHIKPHGRFLLDAGSGPIQYPEYLEYSKSYVYRVCVDLSIVALKEARQRIGEHGLFVVADVNNLPFRRGVFDGIVSLHTFHHLPEGGHIQAYHEVYRTLMPQASAVIVNGWDEPPLTRVLEAPLRLRRTVRQFYRKIKRRLSTSRELDEELKGTFVAKSSAAQLKKELSAKMSVEIFVWRSVSVRFLRAFIREKFGGRALLRFLFMLEERFPHFFGENGQYPLIVIHKT